MSEEPKTALDKLLEVLEKCGKAAAAIGILFYVTGLIVANQYLAQFDLSDFGSLKPKYVLTGAWTIFVIIVLGFPGFAIALFFLSKTDAHKKELWQQMLLMVSVGGVVGYMVLNLIRVLMAEEGEKIGFGASFGLICGSVMLCGLVALLSAGPTAVRFLNMLQVIPLILTFSFLSLFILSRSIYGHIKESFGGARPINAELVLNKDGAAFWAQTGVVQNSCNGCTRTIPVKIIYQNDEVMVVQAAYTADQHEGQKLVILRKPLVDAILPVERKRR